MIRSLLSIFLFSVLSCPATMATGQDTIQWQHDRSPISLVEPDQAVYQKFKENPKYDYYHLKPKAPDEEENFFERLLRRLFEWLATKTSDPENEEKIDYTFFIIGAILLVGLFILLYIYQPALFFRNKSRKQDYSVEDDSIYGWDFDRLISNALKDGEYSHAIRWRYLKTLKVMEDKELISWDPNKTVIEYTYEIKNADIKEVFKELSWHFLYFRYGNFEATKVHYQEVDQLATRIENSFKS